VRRLILARHAHAESNARAFVNAVPPGGGLSVEGREEALGLGALLAAESIDVGLSSRLARTQETLELALTGRDVPRIVEPLLDEIRFGSFEGGPLAAYRAWAWGSDAAVPCPGGGESRADAARRLATALGLLLERPEETLLVIGHAMPIRYVVDASDGRFPAARLEPVAHATPFRLERQAVAQAAETLTRWVDAPRFADAPFGGLAAQPPRR
jgi:broad specificity phosphatase PhoE